MSDWAARTEKAIVRDYQLMAPVRPARCALFLPGWDIAANTGCLCIARALDLQVINRQTKIIAVERDARLVPHIAQRLNQFGFDPPPHFHQGELHDLLLPPDVSIDYAMIDLLGNLTEPVAYWLSGHLSGHLAEHATMAFTFTERWRKNNFLRRCIAQWRNPTYRRLSIDFAMSHQLDQYILFHVLMVKTCFAEFDFTYRRAQRYRDNIRVMCGFRFDDFVRNPQPQWPSLDDLFAWSGRELLSA